ncbi:MAG: aldehyde dehydrogenase [Clostridia bacterium]|nr:aldehyde dehydrogenase [Clostridia bacterium]MDD6039792.1 aldehyde dehydrogenase [Clostridia bacterium]
MDFEQLVARQRDFFGTQATKPYDFRIKQLQKLSVWMDENEQAVLEALQSDLGKCAYEAYLTELAMVKQELRDAMRHLKGWMKPRRARTAVGQLPGTCRVYSEPYGVTLIMSPWNYPFQLTVAPLIGAVSAGNCAVIKPSAYSAATSALLKRMTGELFEPEYIACVEGGRQENAALLHQRFDYIFFTGSPGVGRLVMEKASAHLTPVSLELGGKSPVIVDETADIALAARRIAWGKWLNAGQTCVAPDYVLVHQRCEEALVEALIQQIRAMYTSAPLANPDYPQIINQRHFERLAGLMQSGVIAHGGQLDPASRRIAPTLLTDVDWDSPVMQEEIFGPLLPILPYHRLEEALDRIRQRPKPLALYLFTRSKAVEARVLREVSFGGGCVNDTVLHLATSHMPFGGVGESGMGGYHGRYSFETFSHFKSVLKRWAKPDVSLRYAPYDGKMKLLKKLM